MINSGLEPISPVLGAISMVIICDAMRRHICTGHVFQVSVVQLLTSGTTLELPSFLPTSPPRASSSVDEAFGQRPKAASTLIRAPRLRLRLWLRRYLQCSYRWTSTAELWQKVGGPTIDDVVSEWNHFSLNNICMFFLACTFTASMHFNKCNNNTQYHQGILLIYLCHTPPSQKKSRSNYAYVSCTLPPTYRKMQRNQTKITWSKQTNKCRATGNYF